MIDNPASLTDRLLINGYCTVPGLCRPETIDALNRDFDPHALL